VIALDTSDSMGPGDQRLQREGFARALSAPGVRAAIAQAGAVDAAVAVWGGREAVVWPWRRLSDAHGRDDLAQDLLGNALSVGGETHPGSGIAAALDRIGRTRACAGRAVVNVSGDGRESLGRRSRPQVTVAEARERAALQGVTVNALAIEADEAGLAAWFEDAVIVGPGAFAMAVSDMSGFAEAAARKLAREIAPPALADGAQPKALAPAQM
jgi:hypothetical protein